MQWAEARRLYPDTFLLLEEKKSHVEHDELYVEEVAVIRALVDGKEALDELMQAKGDVFVYHTSREKIIMPIRSRPSYKLPQTEPDIYV